MLPPIQHTFHHSLLLGPAASPFMYRPGPWSHLSLKLRVTSPITRSWKYFTGILPAALGKWRGVSPVLWSSARQVRAPTYLFIAPWQKAKFFFQAFYLTLQILFCRIRFINDFIQRVNFLFRRLSKRLLIFISVGKGTQSAELGDPKEK